MNSCYSDDIVFSDPAFGLLKGEEVKYMWEMLCTNAKDFSLTFSNIQLQDEEYATCNWIASYTFSKTGKKVVNRIKAFMKLKDGKIIEHSDAFRLSTWAAQPLTVDYLLTTQVPHYSSTPNLPAFTSCMASSTSAHVFITKGP